MLIGLGGRVDVLNVAGSYVELEAPGLFFKEGVHSSARGNKKTQSDNKNHIRHLRVMLVHLLKLGR